MRIKSERTVAEFHSSPPPNPLQDTPSALIRTLFGGDTCSGRAETARADLDDVAGADAKYVDQEPRKGTINGANTIQTLELIMNAR